MAFLINGEKNGALNLNISVIKAESLIIFVTSFKFVKEFNSYLISSYASYSYPKKYNVIASECTDVPEPAANIVTNIEQISKFSISGFFFYASI